ncbi:MAG TPA: sigma-70 family RNA polymerase sigma factor [Armatimonadota bacterium]|nr:sigma-70 family RNA polymerase sigma factor [Armatimonadota bacterium]
MKTELEAKLTEEQVHGLLVGYLSTRDIQVRDKVVLQYKPLVESIARRFVGSGEPLEDLVQEGYIGLITATDLYDAAKGVKFSTYATHFIIGQIKHALRDRGKIIKEPAWLQELNHRMARVTESLSHDFGRQPTNEEIGRVMHLPEDTVAEILTTREIFKVASLDCDQEETSGVRVDLEKVKDDKYTTFQLPVEDKIVLEMAMNKLKLIEQKVIQEFYFNGLNQTEIAKRLGISCNYVSHILRSGTRKLRRILTTEEIREVQMQLQLASRRPEGRSADMEDSVIDNLTGLYTARYLEGRLAEELTRAARGKGEVAFAIVAIDGLDELGARCGAMQRDDALCSLAELVKRTVRRCDIAGRLGDREFGLVLSHANGKTDLICDRVRNAIGKAASTISGPGSATILKARVGYAIYPLDGMNAAELINAARTALDRPWQKRAAKAA